MKLVLFANRLWILHKDNATSAWHRRSWQLVAGMSTSSETRCGRTLCICLYTLFIMISHCIFYAMYCYIHIYIMYIFIHLYIIYIYVYEIWYIWAGLPLHQRFKFIQSPDPTETCKRVSHMDLQRQIRLKDTILANQVDINKMMTRINGATC